MKKKYLFLYIPAGGGHVSTAKAIAKYFAQHYADQTEAEAVDGFQRANRLLKKIIIDGYKKSQTTGQRVFELLYRCNKRWPIAKINQILMSRFLKSDMKRILLKYTPDHIVILHFFMIKPIMKVIKEL
jgi:UDP-N-acetylglucosamine:LPS N-acetylglucosamine transferase